VRPAGKVTAQGMRGGDLHNMTIGPDIPRATRYRTSTATDGASQGWRPVKPESSRAPQPQRMERLTAGDVLILNTLRISAVRLKPLGERPTFPSSTGQ